MRTGSAPARILSIPMIAIVVACRSDASETPAAQPDAMRGGAAEVAADASPTVLVAPSEELVVSTPAETLISTADGTIGSISDITVAPNGSVYLSDWLAHGIHVVDSAGRFVRTIGREGRGPGELSRPGALLVRRDTLAVVDGFNSRLQLLTLDGEPLATRALSPPNPSMATVGPGWVTLTPTGGTRFPALGVDAGELVTVRTVDGTVRARIGHADVETPNPFRIAEEKRLVAEGGIPTAFLNTADAWAGDDGSLWMMIPARATVAKFDSVGTHEWTVEVQDRAFEEVYDRFVSDNAVAEPMSMVALRYLLDAEIVGEDLWVLMGQSQYGAAVVRIIRADGSAGAQIAFPQVTGAQLFAVDAPRRLVYFVRPETADLLRSRY